MEYRHKQSRTQLALYTTCLDDMIADDNSVRTTMDRFVDSLDMASLGFKIMASQGRPPYDSADLLKLYIYGYMNRIRSSSASIFTIAVKMLLFLFMTHQKETDSFIEINTQKYIIGYINLY